MQRVIDSLRSLDTAVYSKLRLGRAAAGWRKAVPQPIRSAAGRYAPILLTVALIAAYTGALSDPTDLRDSARRLPIPDSGVGAPEAVTQTVGDPGVPVTSAAPADPRQARGIAHQVQPLATQNICGRNGFLDTGKVVYPYVPQCLEKFSGDNGGATHRGVYRDRIRVAFYIGQDPQTIATTQAVGGCAQAECWEDYYRVYVDWYSKYYERYGRNIEIVFVRGSGREDNVELARLDADRIAGLNPPVFAAVGGPLQAGPVYAQRLASRGILCFCTASVPQEIYEENAPFVYANLMSSTQAYIHRAEYIGKRLAGRKAVHAGDDATRARERSFGLIWFNNNDDDYRPGVEFFKEELKRYGVTLAAEIEYSNIEGCQIDAFNMVVQLQRRGVTSVIFSGDPLCPANLTEQAQQQQAQWEWIITGSYLTDVATLARRYNQTQWSRAFGVTMLSVEVKDENEFWHNMYKEAQGNRRDPKVDTPLYVHGPGLLMAGIHMAGPRLNPETFREGMARVLPRGGTPTVPKWSMGPRSINGRVNLWDSTGWDDMAEIWWDRNSLGPDGTRGTYWVSEGGKRYDWGEWPATEPKAFNTDGAVSGFEHAPDLP